MSKNLLDYVGLGHFLEKIKTLFVTGLGTSGNNLTWTKNGTTNNITIPYASKSSELIPLQTKLYTGVIGTANNNPGAVFYFMSIRPEDWNKPCKVTYRIYAEMDGLTAGKAFSIMSIVFSRNTTAAYDVWNYIGHTDYRPYYYHYRYLATSTGFSNNYGHLMGIGLNSSYSPTTATYARNFTVEILETLDCTVTLFDDMTKYASVPGTGSTNYSGETTYNATTLGETHSGDANDVNYYNREYYGSRITNSALYRYMLCLTKSDGSLVPMNSVNNVTAKTKTLTTDSFDPFGEIFFWNTTTTYTAGANVGDGSWYRQYLCDLRYSFNCGGYNVDGGGTLTARLPLYLVAVPQTNGTAVLHSEPLSQTLPNLEDGLIYIYLGRVYQDSYPYRLLLSLNHPIYYYKDSAVRLWTGRSYLTSEVDPVFSASPAAGITSTNITAWNGKQDAISDLATIRSGASAGATAYQKPSGGIPKTDLSSAVQTSLGKADTALQSHQDISGKVDKVTSTDNAVVRFDGTSGAVQNSGVTINDSNHVTAAKFITSGGTSNSFVKGDGSLDSSDYVTTRHLYHTWDINTNYWESYSGENNFRMVSENMYADTLRFQASTLSNIQYWDYDNEEWLTWGTYMLPNLFDGSARTNVPIPYTNRKFRFQITASSGWPSTAMFLLQGTWYSSGTVTPFQDGDYIKIIIETRSSTSSEFEVKASFGFQHSTMGTNARIIGSLHTGQTLYRITIEICPWATTANNANFNRLCILSGYSGNDLQTICYTSTGNVIPTKNNDYTLGSSSNRWSNIFSTSGNFSGAVTVNSLVKSGGTSSQFLKADGSVDSTSYGTYSKPSGGIPKTDLASAVQTSLGKADSALQSFTETDPTVPSWAKQSSKPTYTAQEVGALPASTSIPSKTSDLTNDSGFLTQHQDISGKENTSNKVTSLSSLSTDTLYPSAKCVYDLIKDSCVFIEGSDIYLDF